VLHVEPAVSGAPGRAVLTRGGGRVSHWHGLSLAARGRTPAAGRPAVSPVPPAGEQGGRPA